VNLVLVSVIVALLGYIWTLKKSDERSISNEKSGVEDEAVTLPSKHSMLKLIKERRSVMPKDLTGDIMSDANVEYLLEAANWAPTHQRTEPWRYIVIKGDNNILDYLQYIEDWYTEHREEVSCEAFTKCQQKVDSLKSILPNNVSHLFVICMKRQALPGKLLPEWEEICATACSVQNIHLALTALPGWGGYWSSHTWCNQARDSLQFKEYLGLESDDRVFGAFMLGKVAPGKTFRSSRADWRTKVTMRTESLD